MEQGEGREGKSWEGTGSKEEGVANEPGLRETWRGEGRHTCTHSA